jgi:hypothetical protein
VAVKALGWQARTERACMEGTIILLAVFLFPFLFFSRQIVLSMT